MDTRIVKCAVKATASGATVTAKRRASNELEEKRSLAFVSAGCHGRLWGLQSTDHNVDQILPL